MTQAHVDKDNADTWIVWQSHCGTYLPSITSHVDAAYDIPAKGVVYIFTGRVMGSLQSIT